MLSAFVLMEVAAVEDSTILVIVSQLGLICFSEACLRQTIKFSTDKILSLIPTKYTR